MRGAPARTWALIAALVATAGPFVPAALAYSDRAGTDIVMDAPWRSIRDYVPVLFFFPQFEGGRRVERIRIVECAADPLACRTVFVDAAEGSDTLNGATFVGPVGESRGGIESGERITGFWHYVVRLPHRALSCRGAPDVHLLRAEVEWTRPGPLGPHAFRNTRTLRILVDPAPFPSFGPGDLHFDTHAHTIAEQTTSGVLDVNGASKAFAGPIVMLLESAYALGLVETQPGGGNWDAFADRVVVTDHNIFYSRDPYDAGVAPRFGPTAPTDGHAGEAAWYRAHLGRLAGEEITLRRGSRQDGSARPNLGHHLLAYDTRHFEGPWHGGHFLTSLIENPNTLQSVLAGMKAAGPTGFAYASHPQLTGFEWPPEYFAQAIGFPPYNSLTGPIVDSTGREFLFRGSEIWNTKMDQVARDSGRLPASSAFDRMNPFPGGPVAQRFRSVPWDGELRESLDTLLAQIGRGLRFAFRESPAERFVRKLYLSAGSDAHGDFNYADEVTATAVPYSGLLHANAYARVRTCVLDHDRPADLRDPVGAFREGRSLITDGPLLMFQIDADGRHDPAAGAARWHDAEARWENPDGRIGGSGAFDGGGTVLVPSPGTGAWIRSHWLRSATPGAGEIARFHFDRVTSSGRDSFEVAAGPPGTPDDRALPVPLDSLCALVATARDLVADERCITNPVWAAPVEVEIASTAGGDRAAGIAFPAAKLRVTFHFPISMSPDTGTRAFLRPLDSRGRSTDPAIELVPDPGWETENGIASARFSVVNPADVPAPPETWDAESHSVSGGLRSFVVYLEAPVDLHGNRLNDIGRAFAYPAPGFVGAGRRGP